MKNVTNLLKNYHDSFINQTNSWNFFIGLADYTKFVAEDETCSHIISELLKERDELINKRLELEKQSIEELKKSKKKIFDIIKNKGLNYKSLDDKIKEFEAFESGKILTSKARAEAYDDYLRELAINLFQNKHKELLADFADNDREIENIYGNYSFSKTLSEYRKEVDKFSEKRKVELWGAWDELNLAYLVIYKKDETLEELHSDKKNFWTAHNFFGLAREMEEIRSVSRGGAYTNHLHGSSIPAYQFTVEQYKQYAFRIHNYLLKELSKDTVDTKEGIKLEFDLAKGILKIGSKQVNVRKYSDQYHLLAIIFQEKDDFFKTWFFSEIAEHMDEAKPPKDKKIYNIAYQLNTRIASKAHIDDFFVTTAQSLELNKKQGFFI